MPMARVLQATRSPSFHDFAGGLTPQGGLPPWVTRRLDAAADVQQRQQTPARLLCLGGGTPHKPAVLGPSGHVVHEASACASYLMAARGVPAAHVLKEVSSYDTVGYVQPCWHALPAKLLRALTGHTT